MTANTIDKQKVVEKLNRILEMELAGVVHYTHYSLMVYGFNRIPIVSWLRDQAKESLSHAEQAGEWITTLGEHPSLAVGPLLETHRHNIGDILKESMEHEKAGLELYRELLELVKDKAIGLEEYCRNSIALEESHLSEVEKMLRSPGS